MSHVRVASVQGSSVLGDTQANVARFSQLCREASAGGARIIVLPEACLTGYLSEDLCWSWHVPGRPLQKSQVSGRTFKSMDPSLHAECVPGPLTEAFCDLSHELGVYITVPFVEKAEVEGAPVYFNTICLASPEGEIVAHYRKNNLWNYVDDAWLTAGNGTAVAETPYGRVGLAVCYDVHIMFDRYMSEGLWTLLYCIAWVDSDTPAWFESHLPSRVARAGYHVIASNWSVSNDAVAERWKRKCVDGYGFSSIYDSTGERLVTAARQFGDEIVYAELPVSSSVQAPTRTRALPVPHVDVKPGFVGRWQSDFYGPVEEQEVEVTVDGLKAVKVTGDLNVPAGMVTWWTKGIPNVGGCVEAWFRQRVDPSDANGFYWERSELKAVSPSELCLTLLEGGRLRGETGTYLRVN